MSTATLSAAETDTLDSVQAGSLWHHLSLQTNKIAQSNLGSGRVAVGQRVVWENPDVSGQPMGEINFG